MAVKDILNQLQLNQLFKQFTDIFKTMPMSRKIVMGAVLGLVVIGFASLMFLPKGKIFQPLFTDLSSEDASEIVNKLKTDKIPYELDKEGTVIKVPKEMVYDVRLSIAQAGLPKKGTVGFEIFDKTDFGVTEFVQKLNYQRAVQGELARTISKFQEVEDAKVMIVLPEESVFIEETKPPSASVLLKLKSKLSEDKIAAVVHLVSSAVKEMTPERVTIVDSVGKVLAPIKKEDDTEEKERKFKLLAKAQLDYKVNFEQNLAKRIQFMLEGVVGRGKAFVQVSAEMIFDEVDINEELFDPDVQLPRSRQSNNEKSDKKTEQ
ncbi:MAG: flagellar M-ring protein FliF, partial [Desulfobacterales bacterium]|nr:flagellar M-ring protein FliF [Desulfobacterales bacterium]